MVADERTRKLVAASSEVVLANHVEPTADMRAERARASFDSEELAAYLNGGRHKLQRKAELVKMLSDSEWGNKSRRYFLTRQEEYTGALQGILGIWDLVQDKQISLDDALLMRQLFNLPGGLELHIGMFIPSILSQASEEQQAKWLPLAQNLRIIGTYAQTELGHGTFVRGLETTATYDVEREEFVVHSPTLSSTKWWPGGLGKTATHVILMARLFVDSKDYGPHAFIVQIRTLDTHRPLPGIKVGDIGPKAGYNAVDNGYLSFDHVRIPREAMLMRFAKVSREGKYSPPPAANSKASYATMVYVRATIVEEAGWVLAKAATIAIRYNAVRRQTTARAGQKELQVLDYQNTAAELLPLLAASYALIFMGKSAMGMYKQFEADRDRGEFSSLPELHAVLSGLKALSTWITSDGIEACRRGCGGHGYSLLSGLPTLFASYVQNATWEGDNNVMCLQTARYLLKNLLAVQSGKPAAGSAAYLQSAQQEMQSRCSLESAEGWLQAEPLLAAFRHRATRLCIVAVQALQAEGGGKLAFEGPAWNACTVDMIRLARAHSLLVLYSNFADSVKQLASQGAVSAACVAALRKLVALYGLTSLLRELGDFLEDGYMSGSQASQARQQQYALLRGLRPDAVALVDSFGFEDYLLNSALGRKDGDVYRDLLQRAEVSPLNASEEGPAWEGILKTRLAGPHARL
ncbi:hypothetical protein WJX72_012328 [[Myrmecia] bisecta]|uniref:Acyl-coenzyme A oxidase n=1 Tax=[Myrmecia] bisecta TaxID=41462 RepID=A0AAW1QT19_9CHLO